MIAAYYNDNDPFAAAWLRELIADGLIAPGDVDERSILDVKADDLKAYRQCHFFAGIGGWSYALRLAGWDDDRPVWTGSCPCQPLSVAGNRKGHADERHVWPAFHALITERRPSEVFGEQVASKDGREWLAGIRADLEDDRYAVGAADMCAAGVGAPHIRQRLWWFAKRLADTGRECGSGRRGVRDVEQEAVRDKGTCEEWQRVRDATNDCGTVVELADAQAGGQRVDGRAPGDAGYADLGSAPERVADTDGRIAGDGGLQSGRQHGQLEEDGIAGGGLGHAEGADGRGEFDAGRAGSWRRGSAGAGQAGSALGDTDRSGREEQRRPEPVRAQQLPVEYRGRSVLLGCSDGKFRRVPTNEAGEPEPALFPLAYGIPNRLGTLRGAGNAINPVLAAQFIAAADEVLRTGFA